MVEISTVLITLLNQSVFEVINTIFRGYKSINQS